MAEVNTGLTPKEALQLDGNTIYSVRTRENITFFGRPKKLTVYTKPGEPDVLTYEVEITFEIYDFKTGVKTFTYKTEDFFWTDEIVLIEPAITVAPLPDDLNDQTIYKVKELPDDRFFYGVPIEVETDIELPSKKESKVIKFKLYQKHENGDFYPKGTQHIVPAKFLELIEPVASLPPESEDS